MQEPGVIEEKTLIQHYGKRVLERVFEDPDGQTRSFVLWGGEVTPVIVFPVTADRKIVTLRQFRRAANRQVVEIPGGQSKPGQDHLTCARQELLEETGYATERIIQLGQGIWFDPASCITTFVPFLALDCKRIQGQELDKTERSEIEETFLVSLGEWLTMISSGEICDSKTIATTLLALPYLGYKL